MERNDFCKQHARIDDAVERSEKMFAQIFCELKKKASNATLKWGVGIFIIIMMGVIGFMWGNIKFQETRLDSNHQSILQELKSINEKIRR